MNTINLLRKNQTLEEIMDEVEFPDNAVFLGVAEDGFPVLFNVLDEKVPNILIWQGRVDILKVIAEYIMRVQKGNRRKTDIEFLILTSNPEHWKFLYNMSPTDLRQTPCIAVALINSDLADQLILSLASWVHDSKKAGKTVLVLVDDISKMFDMEFNVLNNMKYVLHNGSRKSVFVIGTSDDQRYVQGFQDVIVADDGEYRLVCRGENTKFWLPTTIL